MSLKKLMINTLKTKKRDVTAYLVNTFLIMIFYFLSFENSEVLYPLLLSLFVFFIYIIVEIVAYRRESEKINDSKKSPNYSCNYDNPKEQQALEAISEIHREYNKKFYNLNQSIKDKDTLFSQWIHNMKTSISVIDLAYENSNINKDFQYALDDIKEENTKLKKNLEQCLNILRLEEFSKDYVTNKCNLYSLVNKAINYKKREFIYKGVFPKVEIDKSINIYTDEKWFSYMIEQIISNGIKYSIEGNKSKLYIKGEKEKNKVILYIKDYGIGIKNEDLARIFDAFFTGNNGRVDRNATGIGLYMVKLISEKLGIKVSVESKIDVGTEFKIEIKI